MSKQYTKPISIIMVAWKREEFTKRSIWAIKNNTHYPYRLTVIVNESGEPFRRNLADNWVYLKKNWGLEPAKNLGMNFVKSRLFVSTDNDILPMKPNEKGCWLTQLVELMKKYPNYAAISSRTQVMIGTEDIFGGKEEQDIVEFPHPGGSLRIMRTKPVRQIGWRKEVKLRGAEERWIGSSLRNKGWKTGFATKVKSYHLFGDDENWGYGDMKPQEHGHQPVWHPALKGDDLEELKNYE